MPPTLHPLADFMGKDVGWLEVGLPSNRVVITSSLLTHKTKFIYARRAVFGFNAIQPTEKPANRQNKCLYVCVSLPNEFLSIHHAHFLGGWGRRHGSGRGRRACRQGFMEYFWRNFLFLYAFNELWWGSLSQTPNSPLPWHRNQHPFRFYWTFFINFRISRNLLPFFSALPGAYRTIQTLSRIVCLNDNFLAFCKRKVSENVV